MILYKFKKLEPFVHVADTLLTKRLYCPKPSELNDPLEGLFGVSQPISKDTTNASSKFDESVKFALASLDEADRFRVCCFSANPESILMWSYYGNGHSGICLELDMTPFEHDLIKVEYLEDMSPLEKAGTKDRLRCKSHHWKHEEEYRLVFGQDEKFKFIKAEIKAVLIGTGIKGDYIRPVFELCRMMKYSREIVSFNNFGKFTRYALKPEVPWD